jgi:hypothetical protein
LIGIRLAFSCLLLRGLNAFRSWLGFIDGAGFMTGCLVCGGCLGGFLGPLSFLLFALLLGFCGLVIVSLDAFFIDIFLVLSKSYAHKLIFIVFCLI